jgi:hypothetical protein
MKTRRTTKQEKELADNTRLLRAWRAWHREQLETALAGRHGSLVAQLMQTLRRLELQSGPELLGFIRAQDWRAIDADTRFILLHEINSAVTKLRERHGRAPFDDPLPGKRENVFRTIRSIVTP